MKKGLKVYMVKVDLGNDKAVVADCFESARQLVHDFLCDRGRKAFIKSVKEIETPYANERLYTDVEPWEVVSIDTPKKLTIRKMTCVELPWERDFIPGGFVGHTANDREQKWDIKSDEAGLRVSIRLHKDLTWRIRDGQRFSVCDKPVKFYDNNF